jgi:DNA-binding LacI/PurR family transcriptional regulator
MTAATRPRNREPMKPGRPTRPTLTEVALRAGVSPSTVSRVVRGSTPVSPKLEHTVREAIAATGYAPNLAARQLVTSRSDTIGVVIAEDQRHVFGEPFFADMIEGVTAGLSATPFRFILVVARSKDDRSWLQHYVGSRHVDGVMLIAPQRRDPLGRILQETGVPVVFMGRPFDISGCHYVDADNVGGVKQAVQHLYGRDRRHIAMITGIQTMRSGTDRLAGYRRGMETVGLDVDERRIVGSDYTEEGGERAMRELLDRKVPIDAVVAASDLSAVGALRALKDARIRVPQSVSVIGFGDDPNSARHRPALTTVAQPSVEMGRQLAMVMVDAIEGRKSRRRVVMPTQLVVRETA